MRLELSAAPGEEPITLAQAKTHLRVDHSDHDSLITTLIAAARRMAEERLARRLITQTWIAYFDDFADELLLSGLSPVASITDVKYLAAADGALTVLDPSVYQLIKTAPAKLVEAYDQTWPDARCVPEAVRVTAVCGYGAAAAVPEPIVQWMLIAIGTMYKHAEGIVTGTIVAEVPRNFVDGLLDPYRVLEFR